jgi:hypothetical protein
MEIYGLELFRGIIEGFNYRYFYVTFVLGLG